MYRNIKASKYLNFKPCPFLVILEIAFLVPQVRLIATIDFITSSKQLNPTTLVSAKSLCPIVK